MISLQGKCDALKTRGTVRLKSRVWAARLARFPFNIATHLRCGYFALFQGPGRFTLRTVAKSGFSSFTIVAVVFLWTSRISSSVFATPPISNADADYVASTSALIEWQTQGASDSRVEYSTDPNFANSLFTTLDPALVTSHYVEVTGLNPDTTYYYRIRSGKDISSPFTFKTLTSSTSTWPADKGIGSTPIIKFSDDETTVSISYKNKTDDVVNNFTFYRPVVSDWNYTLPPGGRIYWVDGTSGSDSNQGVETSPLKTITKAIALVKAGDIIYVKAGTYVEPVVINKSGEKDKPIILSAAPGALGKVKIMLPPSFVKNNPHESVISVINGVSNITINGLVIEGPRGTPEAPVGEYSNFSSGIWSDEKTTGIKVTNNVTDSNVHCGIKLGNGGPQDVLIEGNIIFDNGMNHRDHGIYSPRPNQVINGNIIFNNASTGIHAYFETANHQVITRNVVFGNPEQGIIIGGNDNQVFNNTVVFNKYGIEYFQEPSKNNIVESNIFAFNFFVYNQDGTKKVDPALNEVDPESYFDVFYDNGGGASVPSGNLSDHNLYSQRRVIPSSVVAMGPDEKQGNPSFINSKSGDFRQAITSPFQDRGAYAPPKTSNVRVSAVLDQSAVISWATDIAADSGIEYGQPGGTTTTAIDPAKGTSHALKLAGLNPGTSYSFKIATRDATGKIQYSEPQSFKTLVPIQLNLPLPANRVEVNENSALTFAASAVDANLPAQKLTFSVRSADGSALPAGAGIDANTGVFSWTPTYEQGREQAYRMVIGVSNGTLSAEQTVEVTVKNVNRAPVLETIANQTIQAKEAWTLNLKARDDDRDALTFTLDPGAPAGVTLDASTGLLTWTPSEAQAPSTSAIIVRVTDNGTPPLSDSKTFTVTVNEVKIVPVLSAIPDLTVNEGEKLLLQIGATVNGAPVQNLFFVLGSGVPPGAGLDPILGEFFWTPTEGQGPGVYRLTVMLTDFAARPVTEAKAFTVTVNEVNSAPVLSVIPDKNASVGSRLGFASTATDADLPANMLTYSLEPGAPQGATIDPVSGAFTWTPTAAQAGTTNRISIRATDNGVPPLSDSKAFTVLVAGLVSVPAQVSVSLFATGEVKLGWTTTPGRTYTLQRSVDLADWQDLTTITSSATSFEYVDAVGPDVSSRFYRVVQR